MSFDDVVRVLHVDDDPGVGDVVATFLERAEEGLSVVTAASAEAGLGALESREFDCVVSDYEMPGIDGIEFLERVREAHPDLPFILYTGKGSEEIASEAISAGVTDYLQKESGTGQYAVLANRIANAVEQYRAKRTVRETEEKLSQVAEKTDDVLYLFSGDWSELLFVNSSYEEAWGGSVAELESDPTSFVQYVHPEDRAAVRASMERLSNGEADELVYRVVVDGERRWVHAQSKPIIGEDGSVARIAGFARDVTERREREARLRSTTARLEALFENSPDMIAIHDAEGTILDVNARFCEEIGYPADEIVGRSVWEVDETADPEEARAFWADLPTNSPRRFEGRFRRRDGSTFPIEVHLIRLDLDGEDRFVAMDRDITEQRERERKLLRQNERLEEFASVVSHDLRNPLQVAQGRLDLLRGECDSEHAADIDRALRRMDALIDDLLTLAREGENAMDVRAVDLATIVRGCWRTVETDDAALVTEIDGGVSADGDRLRQLFENLFRNAVEHGSTGNQAQPGDAVEGAPGEGRERADGDATVTVGTTPDGFYVADDGPGIPADAREDVFDPGYSTSTEGTGFGLNIVATVAADHGWDVTVSESVDGGARFDVSGVDRVGVHGSE